MTQRLSVEQDRNVPDLVRQLADDSRRLVRDEIRLAKLEASEAVHEAGRGALWLGLAFGVAIVSLVACTLFVAALFGRVANGHYWVGTFLVSLLEVAAGLWLMRRGTRTIRSAPYALPETRDGLSLLKG